MQNLNLSIVHESNQEKENILLKDINNKNNFYIIFDDTLYKVKRVKCKINFFEEDVKIVTADYQ